VAVAWAGSPNNDIDKHRSIPVEWFARLAEIPDVALYSVQVGERAKELQDAGLGPVIHDLSPWLGDANDTARILMGMDRAVVCESFVGHLAGVMAVPTLLLCSRLGRDWRSAPRLGDRTLWYPKTRVIRQGDDRSWGPVFEEVVENLV
jgi:hypothetical protein